VVAQGTSRAAQRLMQGSVQQVLRDTQSYSTIRRHSEEYQCYKEEKKGRRRRADVCSLRET
jgi:hypothetical protein